MLFRSDKQDNITVLRRQGLLVLSVLGPEICSSEPSQHSVIIERATPAKGARVPFLGACLESGGSGLWKPSQGPEFPDRKARKPLFKLFCQDEKLPYCECMASMSSYARSHVLRE